MLYTIRRLDRASGIEQVIERKREDAAFRARYRVTYEAIRDDAALDTQRGWNAINRVNAWTKRHPLEPIHIGTDVITLTVER